MLASSLCILEHFKISEDTWILDIYFHGNSLTEPSTESTDEVKSTGIILIQKVERH